MRARKRAPQVAAPVTPAATAGKHGNAGGLPEEEFDFSLPFEVDLGRAAIIAEALRECGYPDVTAEAVTAELAMPQHDRGIIGRFAVGALERYGWRP